MCTRRLYEDGKTELGSEFQSTVFKSQTTLIIVQSLSPKNGHVCALLETNLIFGTLIHMTIANHFGYGNTLTVPPGGR